MLIKRSEPREIAFKIGGSDGAIKMLSEYAINR